MDWHLTVKTLHILSSTVLFGTGLGIAFFMVRSWFTDNLHERHFASRTTVLADTVFTFPAVVVQPVTGAWLVWEGGFDWTEPWLLATYGLYALAGACWLPVVWLQLRMRNMIREAISTGNELPSEYQNLFRMWFLLGWPAFIGLVIVFFLMVVKPA